MVLCSPGKVLGVSDTAKVLGSSNTAMNSTPGMYADVSDNGRSLGLTTTAVIAAHANCAECSRRVRLTRSSHVSTEHDRARPSAVGIERALRLLMTPTAHGSLYENTPTSTLLGNVSRKV